MLMVLGGKILFRGTKKSMGIALIINGERKIVQGRVFVFIRRQPTHRFRSKRYTGKDQ